LEIHIQFPVYLEDRFDALAPDYFQERQSRAVARRALREGVRASTRKN